MSKKKKLVLLRHGETLFNQRKRVQGWVDSPLTDLGIKQVLHTGEWLQKQNISFDHAYSSTSERACDTLELVSNLPYKRLKELKEWNFGILEGEPEYLNPPVEQYSDFFSSHGGESRDQLVERMNTALLKIMNQEDHQNVLVVSHGAAIRNFERYWCKDDTHLIKGRLYNAAALLFEFDPDTKRFTFTDIYNPNFQG